MSSLIMHNSAFAIRMQNVSKVYKLFGSQRDQIINVLGLHRLGFKSQTAVREYAALTDINLDVPRGHRIGIVGRNGAGKTTLLKLICGNFAPSQGSVEVNGNVQALMNVGLGFHPEFTGRENVEASLLYNGLSRDEYQNAMEGVIDFCELGDFLDQPFKTYSLGMQARLMFAAATAIKPDILIVDEVLGAGDAYFVAKSKVRVEKLVTSGCTMLLVSHSMQQVLELCDEAIWLDRGHVRMRGEAFIVVKAYEEYLHGPLLRIKKEESSCSPIISNNESNFTDKSQLSAIERHIELPPEIKLQVPNFTPHAETPFFPRAECLNEFNFLSPGGLSRWESDIGLKVCGFTVVTERGITNKLISLRPAKFVISLRVERTGQYNCRYGIAIDNSIGKSVARIFSPPDQFNCHENDIHTVEMLLNPVQIGPGDYTIGISVMDSTPLEQLNNAFRYDLLSRSFSISVELPDSLGVLSGYVMHTAEWEFVADTKL